VIEMVECKEDEVEVKEGVCIKKNEEGRIDLKKAYLAEADLKGAYLRGADLNGANLNEADLGGTDLYGADLTLADLEYAVCERDEARRVTKVYKKDGQNWICKKIEELREGD